MKHRHFVIPISCAALALSVVCSRFFIAGVLADSTPLRASADLQRLSAEEQAAGWKLLFDGVSTKGWRGYRKQSFPGTGWKVENGTLTKVGGEQGGDIITEATFENFELIWEWRIAPGGNNGVKYLVTEDRPGAPGHEYQIVDDVRHPDARFGPMRQTASFYDVLPPSGDKKLKKPGDWNESRVFVQGSHVEHWLNGGKVLEYELGSEPLRAAIAKSKFRAATGFGMKIKGHVMLTDHRDECAFRNIRIRELPSR